MPTHISSFPDTATAQRLVQAVVDANTVPIRDWLANRTTGRLRIDGHFPGEVAGRLQLRGMLYAGRGPIEVHGVRVILERDPEQPNGFVVRGSFPTLP